MTNQALFNEYAQEIIGNTLFLQTKNVFSHGTVTIYDHSIAVAEMAFSLIENSQKIDKKCVVHAALLHDFFLYEWHVWGWRYVKHGWTHPAIAAEKAREVFGISDKVYSCIKNHMWPWTLFHFPKSREGWVISLADKVVSVKEASLSRGRRGKLTDPSGQ
jgi:uncharacterized protein